MFLLKFIGWVGCEQDYTKTTERISSKLVLGMGLVPE